MKNAKISKFPILLRTFSILFLAIFTLVYSYKIIEKKLLGDLIHVLKVQSNLINRNFNEPFWSIYNGNSGSSESLDEKAAWVISTWTEIYGLKQLNPPENGIFESKFSEWVPDPPHLQNCVRLTNLRMEAERFPESGRYPQWAVGDLVSGVHPPWVEGGDEENLQWTRLAQRDIWIHQHPLDCKSPETKFLISKWYSYDLYGVGAQLHIMANFLTVSIAINRVLLQYPTSFGLAETPYCQGSNYASLECYFFSMVSEECKVEAFSLLQSSQYRNIDHKMITDPLQLMNFTDRLLILDSNSFLLILPPLFQTSIRYWPKYEVLEDGKNMMRQDSNFEPWLNSTNSVMEVMDENFVLSPPQKYYNWIMSQTIRYMLRWPSSHLCHLVNIAKHEVFGRSIAREQLVVNSNIKIYTSRDEELKRLNENFDFSNKLTFHERVSSLLLPKSFLPHPILNIQVRQGDKYKEMRVFSFDSHMLVANNLRLRESNLQNIWLATEMENVIEETREYPSWKFFYINHIRQKEKEINLYLQSNATDRIGIIHASFVNILISAECDFFIGTLGSNTHRLINELRLTNGRAKSGYLSLNSCEGFC